MATGHACRPCRRRCPARGRITRALVLRIALDIIDRPGIDGLSMRRLCQALGRDPMDFYRHEPKKAALLDRVAEIVLDQTPRFLISVRTRARTRRLRSRRRPRGCPGPRSR